MRETDFVYDIESYPNVFTVTFLRVSTNDTWRFEISFRKNEGVLLFQFLTWIREIDGSGIGFNNIYYDYPVLHQLICAGGHIDSQTLFDYGHGFITSGSRYEHLVWDNEMYFKQIDLYKIHHFDNKNRRTSLKMLEFNMRSDNIQELPYKVGSHLTSDEIDNLIVYNDLDVFETLKFYNISLRMINFRMKLTEQYKFDYTNHNDTKIGKDYFINELRKNKVDCYRYVDGKRQPIQSVRDCVNIKEILLPIEFKRPEFRAVYQWFSDQSITETIGVFADIRESSLRELAKYSNLKVKSKKIHGDLPTVLPPCAWIENRILKSKKISNYLCWRQAKNLNVTIDGFQFDFGTGGIHGSVSSTVIESDADYQIVDLDVASYYPNLSIKNNFYPEHLGARFCEIYLAVYELRKQHPKGTPENAMLKLALNGVYGDSNSEHSVFYDPKYTMSITVNGQLLLCLLAEMLLEIENLSMIQINTDGLTVKCPRKSIDQLTSISKQWEAITKLELERNDYSRMFINSVNDYIAEKTNGKLKRIGDYRYGKDLGWHQNHSAQVVARAAEHALIDGGDIESFIVGHSDKMDFMLRAKVDKRSELRLVTNNGQSETKLQKITRYYVSHNGGELMKTMPTTEKERLKNPNKLEKHTNLESGWTVETCNVINEYGSGCLNYQYYIDRAKKLVDPLLS